MTDYSIGEVAERAGVPATTLRYYEDADLLHPARRVAGRRRYDEAVFARLDVIALCKAAGFTLEEIRLLLRDDAPGRPDSRALAHAKLAAIDRQLDTLARARAIVEWGIACTCPTLAECSCGAHLHAPPAATTGPR
ncbi:MerR family transcriptional regulator [Nocardia farcinica]|uniref:MerR family transcriptional regulator n=1 Tax=Nocardia farcinica TaxID=37329 RepID=UPI0024580BAC|nr:MerR family transcriptional regulator [Nocardia farcinica]